MLDIHAKWGRLPLKEVAEPAIRLGRDGFVVGAPMAYILKLISTIFSWTPESKELCFIDGRLPADGDRMFNGGLADVLDAVAKDPKDIRGVYEQLSREFGPANGGLITLTDLDEMAVNFHKPINMQLGDWNFSTMSPPSTGGCLIALGLRLLDGIGKRHSFMSEGHLAEIVDVQRRLLQVRTSDFDERVRTPDYVERILSDSFVETLLKESFSDAAIEPVTLSVRRRKSVLWTVRAVQLLSLTSSGEGCGCVLSGTGIQVNNLLGEADINPRGFHQDPAGIAMSTMMAPTLAHRGREMVALGSGGTNRLRNAIMMTLINFIE